jgi:hypothetical protein
LGDDTNSGCVETSPLATINACASKAGNAGTCLVSPGTYHESVSLLTGVTGLTIAASGEGVIVDGTVSLGDLTFETLTSAAGVSYYRSTTAPTTPAWQLFANGEPLTPARWPDADVWSDRSWSRETGWATSASGSSCGYNIDAGTSEGVTLASTGVSMDGCNLVINNEHWVTRRYVVANHTAGTGTLGYERDATGLDNHYLCEHYGGLNDGLIRYYIDGCPAALNAPGEFAYDADGHLLLLAPWSLASVDITTWDLKGKTQAYALAFVDCPGLTISGLNFFATTLFVGTSLGATVAHCTFEYPSASRRAIGAAYADSLPHVDFGVSGAKRSSWGETGTYAFPPSTLFGGNGVDETRYTFYNNTVNRAEGSGVQFFGVANDTIENNLLTDVRMQSSNPRTDVWTRCGRCGCCCCCLACLCPGSLAAATLSAVPTALVVAESSRVHACRRRSVYRLGARSSSSPSTAGRR